MPLVAAYAAVLLAALAHASWNALLKTSGDRVLMLAAIRLVGLVAGIVTAIIVPLPSTQALPYLLAAAAIHYAYFGLMIASYRVGDMNQVYPIARGIAPLLVLLPGALLAGEVFGAMSMLGVCLLSAGVLLLASGTSTSNRKAIMLALCTGVAIAGYSFLSGLGIRKGGTLLGYIAWLEICTGIGIGMVAFAGTRGKDAMATFAHGHWRSAVAAGVLSVGGYAIALAAMSIAPIAQVVALRETSVVFAACIGSLFFGREIWRQAHRRFRYRGRRLDPARFRIDVI
ncbi:EamA family transporter [Massilia sp. TWR1-2-2]|uniref:EamA family transporter n=1 Tax=Massilia sp. TWR1-2-2 TaxID=2804584 RepID=UPI003CF5C33B